MIKFGNLGRLKKRAPKRDEEVERSLDATLYEQPFSQALGMAGGIFSSVIGAWISHRDQLAACAVLMIMVGLARLAGIRLVKSGSDTDQRRGRQLYETTSVLFAAVGGASAALSFILALASQAIIATIGFAIAFGAGAAARNAGQPRLAITQIILVVGLPTLALLTRQTLPDFLLALCMFILITAMISVTLYMYRSLRRAALNAQTSHRLAERMKGLARSDTLTGLNNRAGLNHAIAKRVSQLPAVRKLALFWLDLDRFKEVNDTLGHHTGDQLLTEIATRLIRLAPANSTLARFGGDEFILVCELSDRRSAQKLSLHIMDEIMRPMRLDGHALEVSGSLGVALMPDDGVDTESWMQAADLALYEAKARGKAQAMFFDTEMTRAMVRRREIEAELRVAIQNDELSVHYQPIVDLETERIHSFEALARWTHPELGQISPEEFIPVAEESGVIITLGNWLTERAARDAAAWPDDVTLAVNLSPLQIKTPGAVIGIVSALRKTRLNPARLEIEVTESALLEHSEETQNFIDELRLIGVKFALDDFGTGYSSLGTLNAFPFSRIKVDRSFVSGVNAGPKCDAIIRAVSGMATTLGMEIVAEGIETAEQAAGVRAAGCTHGQGWHYSRAVTAEQIPALLAHQFDIPTAERRVA